MTKDYNVYDEVARLVNTDLENLDAAYWDSVAEARARELRQIEAAELAAATEIDDELTSRSVLYDKDYV